MAKDIDLTSKAWLSLIFEGKNKEYGAYEMREDSSNRHLKALLVVMLTGLALVYLPRLAGTSAKPTTVAVSQNTEVKVVDFTEQKPIDEPIAQIPATLPPSIQVATEKFTELVIVEDTRVKDSDLAASQIALTDNKAAISVETVISNQFDPLPTVAAIPREVMITEPESDPVVDYVEVMPQFPGGEKALMKYLSDNIHYPSVALEQNIKGRVVVRFVVGKKGEISRVEVVRPLDPSCDKEAVRVIKSMPSWTPGKLNGNAVNVYYTLPIVFQIRQ